MDFMDYVSCSNSNKVPYVLVFFRKKTEWLLLLFGAASGHMQTEKAQTRLCFVPSDESLCLLVSVELRFYITVNNLSAMRSALLKYCFSAGLHPRHTDEILPQYTNTT